MCCARAISPILRLRALAEGQQIPTSDGCHQVQMHQAMVLMYTHTRAMSGRVLESWPESPWTVAVSKPQFRNKTSFVHGGRGSRRDHDLFIWLAETNLFCLPPRLLHPVAELYHSVLVRVPGVYVCLSLIFTTFSLCALVLLTSLLADVRA